ncbi:MAG: hypothetical protein FWE74_11005 [Oscillospiraceae bacterium]|nr:hypothetical protein [Oscillospiraceae bacterium]
MKQINACRLTAAVTAAANLLAKDLPDGELNLMGAVFTQLGDTLTTIAAVRELNSQLQEQPPSSTVSESTKTEKPSE